MLSFVLLTYALQRFVGHHDPDRTQLSIQKAGEYTLKNRDGEDAGERVIEECQILFLLFFVICFGYLCSHATLDRAEGASYEQHWFGAHCYYLLTRAPLTTNQYSPLPRLAL